MRTFLLVLYAKIEAESRQVCFARKDEAMQKRGMQVYNRVACMLQSRRAGGDLRFLRG